MFSSFYFKKSRISTSTFTRVCFTQAFVLLVRGCTYFRRLWCSRHCQVIPKPQQRTGKRIFIYYYHAACSLKVGRIWSKYNFKILIWTWSEPSGTFGHGSGVHPLVFTWYTVCVSRPSFKAFSSQHTHTGGLDLSSATFFSLRYPFPPPSARPLKSAHCALVCVCVC